MVMLYPYMSIKKDTRVSNENEKEIMIMRNDPIIFKN